MTEEQREEHYKNMGTPYNIKRKKLYFNQISLFTSCVLKYLKPYLVFRLENENYGGLKNILAAF